MGDEERKEAKKKCKSTMRGLAHSTQGQQSGETGQSRKKKKKRVVDEDGGGGGRRRFIAARGRVTTTTCILGRNK